MADLQEHDIEAFRNAVIGGHVDGTRSLLQSPAVRARVNDPMFAFGQRAAHVAAKDQAMLTVLIGAGADVNLKSDWENGPYTVLDCADESSARFLLTKGATLTAHVTSRLGWYEALQALVNSDPPLVHARGGDGQQPLHEAKTVAIADFLLDRGAEIDARCIDHKSTPAQYALVDRPDVCRRLLERGATPDIFMAARLGDLELASRLLDSDPTSVAARINEPGYALVPPMHIYCWSLGFGRSPHDVALASGHRALYDLLVARSPESIRFINAALAGDESSARAILAERPSLLASLSRQEHGGLALAIFHERFEAADVMLSLGFDAGAPGVDGGSALHAACWVGHARLVERILALGTVPVDARDPTHQSTPLGWTAFGSVHRRAKDGDYVAVIDRLLAAGADPNAPANGQGRTLVEMARGNPGMQEALRSRGAA